MALTEPGDHRVVGDGVADNEAVTGIAAAQPFDHPARADAMRVGVDQQSQQHLRSERRLPGTAQFVVSLERAQVHHRHRVDDQVDDVAFRQSVHHVSREQESLTSFRCAKMVRHRSTRVVAQQRSNRASPGPSTPKRTKTRHPDVPEGDCATGSRERQIGIRLAHAEHAGEQQRPLCFSEQEMLDRLCPLAPGQQFQDGGHALSCCIGMGAYITVCASTP